MQRCVATKIAIFGQVFRHGLDNGAPIVVSMRFIASEKPAYGKPWSGRTGSEDQGPKQRACVCPGGVRVLLLGYRPML